MVVFPTSEKAKRGPRTRLGWIHVYHAIFTHTGSPQIDPEFWSDENTSRHLATNHGARVLNLTDEQILWEYNNIGANKKSSIGGSIAGVLLSITALGGAIAGLAFGFKWYIKFCGLVMHNYTQHIHVIQAYALCTH